MGPRKTVQPFGVSFYFYLNDGNKNSTHYIEFLGGLTMLTYI